MFRQNCFQTGHTSTVHVSENVSADFCDSENSEIVATKKQIQKGKPNYTIEDLLKQVRFRLLG